MPSSWIWHRVGILTTNVSEEIVTSVFRVERIRERHLPLKRRLPEELTGLTFQKTALHRVTAMKHQILHINFLLKEVLREALQVLLPLNEIQ